ncbi:hypothetical protein K1719_005369 [Acacia pycnantha]|nr:hypothetical protein K1719_005369 [Acacia pycnantha]
MKAVTVSENSVLQIVSEFSNILTGYENHLVQRAVAPTGHVYTFDFYEQRAASSREDFERTGLSSLISVNVSAGCRLVLSELVSNFAFSASQIKDRIVGVQATSKRVASVGEGSGANGSLPCKKRQSNVLSSNSSVSNVMARPNGEARGHSGYLTFARLKCL